MNTDQQIASVKLFAIVGIAFSACSPLLMPIPAVLIVAWFLMLGNCLLLRLAIQWERRVIEREAGLYIERYVQTLRESLKPQWLGDTTCVNNARSPHLRCAVQPVGPCDGCKHYEPSPQNCTKEETAQRRHG